MAYVLPRGVPVDRHGRLPRDLPGPRDSEHGPAHRQARVGDAVPRLELGRRGVGHGVRPGRRQDAYRAAAPGPRPEADVDAGPPAPDATGTEPQRPAQRDDARGAGSVPRGLRAGRPGWAVRPFAGVITRRLTERVISAPPVPGAKLERGWVAGHALAAPSHPERPFVAC